ncbi:MAG: alpha/beta hydrolase [Spirochaetales bacterium]|nr:alpha/beta hydrolase [Spirochaetales bacterium]
MVKNYKCNRGTIEYKIRGKGPAVLIFHGGHDSCRGYFKSDVLVDNGFSVLIPTRPGYRGTDLSVGRSCQESAFSFYTLLDTLKIDNVAVIGVSAGGPTALAFAKNHGDKVRCLILESAVTKPWFHYFTFHYWVCRNLLSAKNQGKFWHNLNEKVQKNPYQQTVKTLKLFTKENSKTVYSSYTDKEKDLIKELLFDNDSGEGFVPDMEHRAGALKMIACPTLIIHSHADASVPFSHATYAHQQIKSSELFIAPVSSHFLYLGPGSDTVLNKRLDFLKQHLYNNRSKG